MLQDFTPGQGDISQGGRNYPVQHLALSTQQGSSVMETWKCGDIQICVHMGLYLYWSESLQGGIPCNDAYWCEVLLSLPGEVYP